MSVALIARRLTVLGTALAVLAAALTSTAAHAQADDRSALSIRPAGQSDGEFFDVQASPGQTLDLAVEIENTGTEPVKARTYSADAYTIVNGGFGLELYSEPVSGTATWLEYPAEELELAPRETVSRSFRVHVPADAQSGEHIAGIAVENADAIRGSGSVAVDQVVRKAIAVVVTLPGPVQAQLEIGDAEHLRVDDVSVVAVELRNPGNVRLRPEGRVVVSDASGSEVARFSVEMDSFYARTGTRLEIPLRDTLPPGRYTVTVVLRDESRGVEASNDALSMVVESEEKKSSTEVDDGGPRSIAIRDVVPEGGAPTLILGAIVALVLVAAGLLWRRRRRPVGRHSAQA